MHLQTTPSRICIVQVFGCQDDKKSHGVATLLLRLSMNRRDRNNQVLRSVCFPIKASAARTF
jgi:hypothetical protein